MPVFWPVEQTIQLVIEVGLLAILWYRAAPRWFAVLIGADCASELLWTIFYRAEWREFARLFARAGDVAIAFLCCLALIEAPEMEAGRKRFWHIRILAFWIAGAKLCGWMEVGQGRSVVAEWNHVLIAVQGVAFAAWIALWLTVD